MNDSYAVGCMKHAHHYWSLYCQYSSPTWIYIFQKVSVSSQTYFTTRLNFFPTSCTHFFFVTPWISSPIQFWLNCFPTQKVGNLQEFISLSPKYTGKLYYIQELIIFFFLRVFHIATTSLCAIRTHIRVRIATCSSDWSIWPRVILLLR